MSTNLDYWIALFCGKMGAGKTTAAVIEIREALLRGENVWMNFHLLKVPDKALSVPMLATSLSDIGSMAEGLWVIDEAYILLNARGWKEFTVQMQTQFAMCRKKSLRVIIVLQSWETCEINVRRVADIARFFDGVGHFTHNWIDYDVNDSGDIVRWKDTTKEAIPEVNRPGSRIFIRKKKVYDLFDTNEGFIEFVPKVFPSAIIGSNELIMPKYTFSSKYETS